MWSTLVEAQEAISAWGLVFAGGISVGFSLAVVVWIGMYSARAVTELFRTR